MGRWVGGLMDLTWPDIGGIPSLGSLVPQTLCATRKSPTNLSMSGVAPDLVAKNPSKTLHRRNNDAHSLESAPVGTTIVDANCRNNGNASNISLAAAFKLSVEARSRASVKISEALGVLDFLVVFQVAMGHENSPPHIAQCLGANCRTRSKSKLGWWMAHFEDLVVRLPSRPAPR